MFLFPFLIYAHNSALNNKPNCYLERRQSVFIYYLKVILWWTPHHQHSLASQALLIEPWATTRIIRVWYGPSLDHSVSSAKHAQERNIVTRRHFSGMRRSITPTKRINYFWLSALMFKKKVWISILFCLWDCHVKCWCHHGANEGNASVCHLSQYWWRQGM